MRSKSDEPPKKKVMVYVPPAVHRGIAEIATRMNRPKSDVYVEAAVAYLTLHNTGAGANEGQAAWDVQELPPRTDLAALVSSVTAQGDALSALNDRIAAEEEARTAMAREMAALGEMMSTLSRRLTANSAPRRSTEIAPATPAERSDGTGAKNASLQTERTGDGLGGKASAASPPRSKRRRVSVDVTQLDRGAGGTGDNPSSRVSHRTRPTDGVGSRAKAAEIILAALEGSGAAGLTGGELTRAVLDGGLPKWAADEAKVYLKNQGKAVRGKNRCWFISAPTIARSSKQRG